MMSAALVSREKESAQNRLDCLSKEINYDYKVTQLDEETSWLSHNAAIQLSLMQQ